MIPGCATILGHRYSDDVMIKQVHPRRPGIAPQPPRGIFRPSRAHFIVRPNRRRPSCTYGAAYLDSHGELTAMYQALIHSRKLGTNRRVESSVPHRKFHHRRHPRRGLAVW